MKPSNEIMSYLAITHFNNQCYVSHHKYKDKDGFAIHHLDYIENDVIRGNYPKGEKGRRLYLNDLLPLVEKEPTRFRLIKKMWHQFVDATPNKCSRINGLSRIKEDEWTRLKQLVEDTVRKTRRKK